MKEIVTLQFGKAANAVGERLWKLQVDQLCSSGPNEVDPSTLLRHSKAAGWHPRALIFDDRAGVSGLVARTSSRTERSSLRYDPRSVVSVGNSHETGASWAADGSAFSTGRDMVTEERMDHFRGLLEACDAVTGLQVWWGT